jgi:hypothetical protein
MARHVGQKPFISKNLNLNLNTNSCNIFDIFMARHVGQELFFNCYFLLQRMINKNLHFLDSYIVLCTSHVTVENSAVEHPQRHLRGGKL